VLVGLSTNKITFDSGLPVNTFWGTVYATVMQGMFADPIYGGNRDKAGWKMIGFPGAIAVHRENVEKYRGRKYTADILGIADLS
jgi:gluconate 2-dehydrogenase gamma chain